MFKHMIISLALLLVVLIPSNAKAASTTIEKDYNNYLTENNYSPDDYVFTYADVAVKKGDKKYATSLYTAYMQALMEAYEEQAKEMSLRYENEMLHEMCENCDDITEDNVSDKEKIVKKLLEQVGKVATPIIEQKLQEYGINVDLEQFKLCTDEQKGLLFHDLMEMHSRGQASENTSAFMPKQTFVTCDGDDYCQVGVAISRKVSTRTLLNNIIQQGANFGPEEGRVDGYSKVLQDIRNNKEFTDEFGVRFMYDKEGYPVFLSFGQADIAGSDNRQIAKRKQKAAMRIAQDMAYKALSALFNSTTDTVWQSHAKSVTDEFNKEDKCTVDSSDNSKVTFEDSFSSMTALNSADAVKGKKVIYKWTDDATHTAGVVLMWSPKTAEDIEELKKALTVKIENPRIKMPDARNNTNSPVKRGMNLDVYDF